MIERDFYWINPQSVVIPKGKLQEKIKKEKHQKMKSFALWQQLAGMWRKVGTPKHEPAEDRGVEDLL